MGISSPLVGPGTDSSFEHYHPQWNVIDIFRKWKIMRTTSLWYYKLDHIHRYNEGARDISGKFVWGGLG
jgi:hypothetical protein